MKRLFCILFSLSLLGCQQDNGEKPDNLISGPKMVRILADIHTMEALIEQNIAYPDTALMVFNKQQTDILTKHGIEEEEFKRTYQYYLNHLAKMDRLYEIVVDTLSVRESKAQAAQGVEPLEEEQAPEGFMPAPY